MLLNLVDAVLNDRKYNRFSKGLCSWVGFETKWLSYPNTVPLSLVSCLGLVKISENLVLKGGLFIYSLTDFDGRVTVDVDFLLRKIPNTPEQLKVVLEEIIATKTGNDFISFEIKDVSPIAIAKKYAGIGASMIAQIKNTRTPFGIDFGVGDVIVPKQEKNKFNFDGATLTEALKKTFENRGHHFTVEQFEQVMTFGSDDAMQEKWKAFCRKIDTKTDDFNAVLRTIKAFLTEPVAAIIGEATFHLKWFVGKQSWG